MTATGLLEVPPDWVTLRTATEEGRPVMVLVDRAVATTAPYAEFTQQIAVAVSLGRTSDGLPAETDKDNLRQLEQHLVDAAAGQARLVAVMTLEGVREWVFYGRTDEWAGPFASAGISVQTNDDPEYRGLQELSGG